MDYTPLRVPLVSFVIAAACLAIVTKAASLPDWLRMLLAALAIIFGVTGVMTAGDWLWARFNDRLRETQEARTWALVTASAAVERLKTQRQLDMVEPFARLEIEGVLGASGSVWTVKVPGANLPLEFWQDFIDASKPTWPELYPIIQHVEFGRRYEWPMSEEKLTQATNGLVYAGYAEKQAGRSARATKPLKWIMQQFKMEA